MQEKHNEHWKIADLPWDRFDASQVDPEILKIIKAASLVEYNAVDYASYLKNVFSEDAAFRQDIENWAAEETQHGEALGQWAVRADPSFDFSAAFARYTAGYRIDTQKTHSVRGSKTGEMIARCIVESGTSSYYTMLSDATAEPVLKALCRHIAADEYRHYQLFHDYLNVYSQQENLGRRARLKIGLSRVIESEDDELAYAYFAANAPVSVPYKRAPNTSSLWCVPFRFINLNISNAWSR